MLPLHGQALGSIEQEREMRSSESHKMPLLLVALALATTAAPGRALERDPHHAGVDAADLKVTVTNKSRRRIEQIALREPDDIELDSDAFGYDGLAPGRQRTFTIPGGTAVCTWEVSVLFAEKEEDCCSDPLPIGQQNLCNDPRIVVRD